MKNLYFTVVLKDGTTLHFDKECNQVDYSNTLLAGFNKTISKTENQNLALIPYDNINYILSKISYSKENDR